jgi:hypothetical protein
MLDRRGLAALPLAFALLACNPAPAATPAATTAAPTSTPPSATSQPTIPPATEEPVPTPVDTGSAGTPACLLADLKASHGLVEGAAGSVLTEVVLVSATTCSVDAFPALALRDVTGDALVGAPSAGPGAIDLVAGVAYKSEVRLANWCAPEPEFPVSLEIVMGSEELAVTGTSFPDDGDLPPCNGEGGPVLEGTGWEPAP